MRLTACILAILPLTHPFSSGIRVASRYVPQKGFGNHALRRGSPYLLRMRATLEGLREGDNVQVVGMKRLKNWEGKQGRVVGQDAQSSKVLVKFPDEDTPLAMSPDRLRRVQPSGTSSESAEIEGTPEVGMRAKIVGMKRLKQYEGREGLVTGMDNATGRLRILLDGETEPLMMAAAVLQRVSDGSSVTCGRVELPPGSVELKNDSGDRVVVLGIAHDDPNSVQSAKQVVQAVNPQNVMVELCWERVPLLMDEPLPPDQRTLFRTTDIQVNLLPGPKPNTPAVTELLSNLKVKSGSVFTSMDVFEDAKKLVASRFFKRVIPVFSPPEAGEMPSFLPSNPNQEPFARQVNPVGTLTWRLETDNVDPEGLQQRVYGLHTYVFRDIAHAVLQQRAERQGIALPPALADRPPETDDSSNSETDSDVSEAMETSQDSVRCDGELADSFGDAVVDPWMQMQKLAQQRAGVTPGEAYRTAMSEALRRGARRIVLGDQPQFVTRTRLGEYTATLSEEEAAQPVADQVALATMDVETKQELMKEYIEGIASEEIELSDEEWENPILRERDEYMTKVLWSLANENSVAPVNFDADEPSYVPVFRQGSDGSSAVEFDFSPRQALRDGNSGPTVAIVGANHIPGIRRLWQERLNHS